MTASIARRAQRVPSQALPSTLSNLVRRALRDALLASGAAGDIDPPALTVERAAAASAPEFLARSHPNDAAARDEARELYTRCLAHYRSTVRPQDQAAGRDDAGAAVAHFVAAAMRALHGISATPDQLLRLQRQLCTLAHRTASWTRVTPHERQFTFEQLAILAVLIDETWSLAVVQGPAAMAHVRQAAATYLRQLLGIEPHGLRLGADGLQCELAPTAGETATA
jgi:uncharacterized protein DUF6683